MKLSTKQILRFAPIFLASFAFSCATGADHSTKDAYLKDKNPVFIPVEKKKPKPAVTEYEKKPYVVSMFDSPPPPASEFQETDDLISINFKKARLESVVKMLSDNGRRFQYVIHPKARNKTVRGFVIKDATWREAMGVLLKIHNLKMVEEKNLVLITTYEAYMSDLKKKSAMVEMEQTYAENQRKYLTSKLESKKILGEEQKTFKTFKLKYTQPDEVYSYLDQVFNNAAPTSTDGATATTQTASTSPSGKGSVSFSIFPKSSIITAYGPPETLKQVELRIAEIDRPQKQVFIESRIVEVMRNYTSSLGIQWGGHHMILSDPQGSITGAAAVGTTTTVTPANPAIDFPATDQTNTGISPAGIAIQLGSALGTDQLNARLSALEQEGRSQTVSNPKVSTVNGVKATIESGREIPYQATSGGASGGTTVEFKNAVLSLEVTPFVTPDEKINLQIIAKKDDADFTQQVQNVPSILTRKIETSVMVENGGTAVLGGVFENVKADTETGVPLLSRIPILGWLFKGKNKTDNEKELLIFISPKIVRNDI